MNHERERMSSSSFGLIVLCCAPFSDRLASDMLWLRDGDDGCLMLFCIQRELDPVETVRKKTWRSVGRTLDVSSQTLEMINLCYQTQQSPTECLVEHFKTLRADEEPTMRKFVKALIACQRNDVARIICDWPWELEQNSNRPLLNSR